MVVDMIVEGTMAGTLEMVVENSLSTHLEKEVVEIVWAVRRCQGCCQRKLNDWLIVMEIGLDCMQNWRKKPESNTPCN